MSATYQPQPDTASADSPLGHLRAVPEPEARVPDSPLWTAGTRGALALAVYLQLDMTCEWRGTGNPDRPKGWVIAPTMALAEQLGLSRNTVARALTDLRDHGLIVLWRNYRRGKNRRRDGESTPKGLACEYLVAHRAAAATIDRAALHVMGIW